MKLIINGWCFCLFVKRLAYSKRRHRELGFVPQCLYGLSLTAASKRHNRFYFSADFARLAFASADPADSADPAGDPLDFASMQKNCSLAAVKRIGNQLKSG